IGADLMDEMQMQLVHVVFDALEIIARDRMAIVEDRIVGRIDLGHERKRRRIAFAEIGKDKAEIFARRISADGNLVLEGLALRGLLDAASIRREFPAVIEAADAIAFHPTEEKLRLTMRAGILDHMGEAVGAAISREMLVQHLDALGAPDQQLV